MTEQALVGLLGVLNGIFHDLANPGLGSISGVYDGEEGNHRLVAFSFTESYLARTYTAQQK